MNRFARNVAIVLLTLVILVLLWQFRSAVALFLLSLWFAGTARPVVDRLTGRSRIPRGLAILLVYIVVLSVFVALGFAFGPRLLAELQQLTDGFVHTYNDIWREWPSGTGLQQFIVERLPPPDQLFNVVNVGGDNPIGESVLGFFFGSVSLVGQIVLAAVLSIYWTSDRVRFERLWLSLMPADMRMRARTLYRQVEEGVGVYTRSLLLQALAAGVLLGFGYAVMGVPYATLLAVVGAIAWLLPWVGLAITVLLVVLAAMSVGPLVAVLGFAYTLAVYVGLIYVIKPRLFPRERFSLLIKLIFVIALGSEFGLVGIIVAPPLAAALQLIARNLTRQPASAVNQETIRHIADLNRHLDSLEHLALTLPEEKRQPIESIMERLGDLIDRAKDLAEDESIQNRVTAEDDRPVAARVTSR